MASYYEYLAAGLLIEDVAWSEPYIDASGMGEMITGSKAVYAENDGV